MGIDKYESKLYVDLLDIITQCMTLEFYLIRDYCSLANISDCQTLLFYSFVYLLLVVIDSWNYLVHT